MRSWPSGLLFILVLIPGCSLLLSGSEGDAGAEDDGGGATDATGPDASSPRACGEFQCRSLDAPSAVRVELVRDFVDSTRVYLLAETPEGYTKYVFDFGQAAFNLVRQQPVPCPLLDVVRPSSSGAWLHECGGEVEVVIGDDVVPLSRNGPFALYRGPNDWLGLEGMAGVLTVVEFNEDLSEGASHAGPSISNPVELRIMRPGTVEIIAVRGSGETRLFLDTVECSVDDLPELAQSDSGASVGLWLDGTSLTGTTITSGPACVGTTVLLPDVSDFAIAGLDNSKLVLAVRQGNAISVAVTDGVSPPALTPIESASGSTSIAVTRVGDTQVAAAWLDEGVITIAFGEIVTL